MVIQTFLNDNIFFGHRSHLVNLYYVDPLKDENFILKNGKENPILRRKKAEADTWFFPKIKE